MSADTDWWPVCGNEDCNHLVAVHDSYTCMEFNCPCNNSRQFLELFGED